MGTCVVPANTPPEKTLNLLIRVAPDGLVEQQVELPAAVNNRQSSMGFEGVAAVGIPGVDELVYVAFQRPWLEDTANRVRIGRYEVATDLWTFFYYPLDVPPSPTLGGAVTVGLSELVATGNQTFAVIERDNQAGPDARIKKIYSFSIAGLTPQPQGSVFPVVTKVLVRDLINDLKSPNGLAIEKVEGLTRLLTAVTSSWSLTTTVLTERQGKHSSRIWVPSSRLCLVAETLTWACVMRMPFFMNIPQKPRKHPRIDLVNEVFFQAGQQEVRACWSDISEGRNLRSDDESTPSRETSQAKDPI